MIKQIQMVADFHKKFSQPILTTPTIPSMERSDLRIELIQEELNETSEAIKNNDLIEVVDGVADMLYVVFGLVNEFGLGDKIEDIFAEVHRSNMSKACKDINEAKITQEHYFNLNGTETYVKESFGTYLVYRSGDDKVLKSINYSPADIKKFL